MGKFVKIFVLLVVLIAIMQETDARRKILRGRKTINRTYMRPYGVPGWVIVVLTAIAQLVIGGLFYLLLKVTILDKPIQEARYQRAPVGPEPAMQARMVPQSQPMMQQPPMMQHQPMRQGQPSPV